MLLNEKEINYYYYYYYYYYNMPKMDMNESISSDCWFEFGVNLE